MSQVRSEPPSRSDSLHGDPQVDPAPVPAPSTGSYLIPSQILGLSGSVSSAQINGMSPGPLASSGAPAGTDAPPIYNVKWMQSHLRMATIFEGQNASSSPSTVPNSTVASPNPSCSTPSQSQSTTVEEQIPSQEHSVSHQSLGNGTTPSKAKSEGDFTGAAEAVTRQPQSRGTVQIHPTTAYTPLLQNGAGHMPDLGSSKGEAGNGVLRSELSSLSGSQKPHRKLQSHHSINSQISKKSKGSTKSASSQIPTEAQEDCCVHCILSCLFCEFLTLCNIMLDCATCGSCSSEDSCICCCCCGSGECADCDLPCDMDCGIIDACCESADCLEICMECCGLCFSS